MQEYRSLGLKEAKIVVEAGVEAARKTGNGGITIAVVDRHGDALCLMRMDGTGASTVHMALAKAYSAIGLLKDTIEFRETMTSKAYDLHPIPNFTVIPGGVLIKGRDGTILGAVGTSGRQATGPGSDEELARGAAAALDKTVGSEG